MSSKAKRDAKENPTTTKEEVPGEQIRHKKYELVCDARNGCGKRAPSLYNGLCKECNHAPDALLFYK